MFPRNIFIVCTLISARASHVLLNGEPFVIWNTLNSSCEKKCGPIDLPDTPARAFVDESTGETVLVAVDSTSRLSRGTGLLNTTRNCTIVWNSTESSDPAIYATNDGFLDAVHSFGNGTVVALLHDEYPGMNYNNCNIKPFVWPGCWTVSMSLAVSQDWGRSWAHSAPPPANLVAAVPYVYQPTGHVIYGWGDSGGITPHPSDGFFYVALNNRMAVGLQSNDTCVMRSNSLLDPRSWRTWNGSAFSVPFTSAYTLPPGDARCWSRSCLHPARCSVQRIRRISSPSLRPYLAGMTPSLGRMTLISTGLAPRISCTGPLHRCCSRPRRRLTLSSFYTRHSSTRMHLAAGTTTTPL
jgi:hypothetical protein